MSSLVFDFGTEDDEKKEKAGAVSAKEAKSAIAGVSAYEDEKGRNAEYSLAFDVFDSTSDVADAEHPIMVVENLSGELMHHTSGSFVRPRSKGVFQFVKNDNTYTEKILAMDSRFVELLDWLGDNKTQVRLSGKVTDLVLSDGQTFANVYAIYKIHAVDATGKNRLSTEDGFLQLVIGRLLEAAPPEEEELSEDEKLDIAEKEAADILLTDTQSMVNYVACAGSTLPLNIRNWAHRNIALTRATTISPEERRHAQRAISMMLNVQWKSSYFESIDPVEARRILDEELFGMEKVKQRIIETIIQINRTHTLPAYGLLLAGPAGVGKSQVAYAVARILKLPWTSLDMSTIHDPEQLTGSPRVYSNAKPGRIMEAFSQAGTSNLVFIINELDKADSGNAGGNPADALLTLLDNLGYTDNYIECMIPTRGVYPIATANDKERISKPLMTRFALIDIPDYTHDEKKVIFRDFAMPKVLKRMGLRPEELIIEDGAIDAVVEKFGDEPGCRDLEQAAEHLAANALYQIETKHIAAVTFNYENAKELLNQ